MAHQIPSAKLELSYPLYGCDFDHADPDSLVVGGGGGPGRNGVGNKITLLDTSNATASEITKKAELELSPTEDNVTSLIVGPRKNQSLTVFAGINSGPDDIKKGKNQHFRVLGISQPNKGGVQISELSRDALFVHKDADTYQRILRLSHLHDGFAQLGAASTGLSKNPRIALFDVPAGGKTRWKKRGTLELGREAMDLDVVQTGPNKYQLAYCDDDEIFTVDVTKDGVSEPRSVYALTPEQGSTAKPSFKSLRYLTPGFLITVVNQPKSAGVALYGYRLPTKEQENARLAVQAKLPGTASKATGLAVTNLSPTKSPSDKQDDTQFVVAVAGNDASISLFTLEHKSAADVDLLANLAPFQVLKSVHSTNITNLSFSPFTPPKSDSDTAREVSVKLASVSVGFTAVVHSIPLKKCVEDKSAASAKSDEARASSRYVVALKSRGESPTALITVVSLIFLLLALIGQTVLEAKGLSEPRLGVNRVLPASWTVPLQKWPPPGQKNIGDLLSDAKPHHTQQLIVKHQDNGALDANGLPDLHVGVHNEEVHGPAKPWEEMDPQDRDAWKARLKKSGHWVEDMGESLFNGVLFGDVGGPINNIVGEAL
ncbi:hypothetical protein F4780DRAFT_769921 [Xylariomycetidae sp. FL0641]|nr:hypothetical protein F4780DRAFT_769921 [Xylariomycetidae sp. FL0641]